MLAKKNFKQLSPLVKRELHRCRSTRACGRIRKTEAVAMTDAEANGDDF